MHKIHACMFLCVFKGGKKSCGPYLTDHTRHISAWYSYWPAHLDTSTRWSGHCRKRRECCGCRSTGNADARKREAGASPQRPKRRVNFALLGNHNNNVFLLWASKDRPLLIDSPIQRGSATDNVLQRGLGPYGVLVFSLVDWAYLTWTCQHSFADSPRKKKKTKQKDGEYTTLGSGGS